MDTDKEGGPCNRRKQQQIENQLKELGMDSLQERLEDAAQTPAKPPYRLARLIQVVSASRCDGRSCDMPMPGRHHSWQHQELSCRSSFTLRIAHRYWCSFTAGHQTTDRQACDGLGSCQAFTLLYTGRCWCTCSPGDSSNTFLR